MNKLNHIDRVIMDHNGQSTRTTQYLFSLRYFIVASISLRIIIIIYPLVILPPRNDHLQDPTFGRYVFLYILHYIIEGTVA